MNREQIGALVKADIVLSKCIELIAILEGVSMDQEFRLDGVTLTFEDTAQRDTFIDIVTWIQARHREPALMDTFTVTLDTVKSAHEDGYHAVETPVGVHVETDSATIAELLQTIEGVRQVIQAGTHTYKIDRQDGVTWQRVFGNITTTVGKYIEGLDGGEHGA